MSNLKKSISAAVGATFVAAMAASPVVNADANPFGMQSLESGYTQVADSKEMEGKCGEGKKVEGKCGEGKCGEGKKDAKKMEGKCGEGKCGEGKKETKMMEGKCGEGKGATE